MTVTWKKSRFERNLAASKTLDTQRPLLHEKNPHMKSLPTVSIQTSLLYILLMALAAAPVWAQSTTEEEEIGPRLPIGMFTVRSLDQSLTNIGTVFEAAGRDDMTDMINTFLQDRAGNLEGIDRTRPFGVMFFLDDSLPPQPTPVAYIPVEDLKAFERTAALGPLKPEKVEGSEDRYKLGGGRRGMSMLIEHDYAFATPNEYILDNGMPDPLDFVSGFAARYDASLSVQLRNVSPLIRDVFIATLQSSAQAELQQKDEESAAAHKIRKANGQSMLELITQILRDGEQVTLGLEAHPEEQMAALELSVDAKPASEFAKFMQNLGGAKSSFEGLHSELHPLTLSVSWMMDRREKEMANGMIEGAEIGLTERLPEEVTSSIKRLGDSLRATVEQGHVNGILQFVPLEDRKFVLIGGLKLVGSNAFGTALRDVFSVLNELEGIDSVDLDAHEHQNVVLHRLMGSDTDREQQRIYGGDPSVYLGSGNGVFWFGLGGDAVVDELDFAIDQYLASSATSGSSTTAPFQLVFRMLPWMDLPERENADPLQRELASEAMSDGGDAVRVEVRPNENGLRVRMQFEKGFVRLLGLVISTQFDASQL